MMETNQENKEEMWKRMEKARLALCDRLQEIKNLDASIPSNIDSLVSSVEYSAPENIVFWWGTAARWLNDNVPEEFQDQAKAIYGAQIV